MSIKKFHKKFRNYSVIVKFVQLLRNNSGLVVVCLKPVTPWQRGWYVSMLCDWLLQ